MLRVLAAAAVWSGQLRGSSAQTCTIGNDIDVSPSTCSSTSCSSYTTIGNGCSGYLCRSYSNGDCDAWDIRCASGSVPHLDFQTMDTESGWDYVYVYDGNNFVRSSARSFSGSARPSDQRASKQARTVWRELRNCPRCMC